MFSRLLSSARDLPPRRQRRRLNQLTSKFAFCTFRQVGHSFSTLSPPLCSFSCQEPSASAEKAADRKRKAAVAQFVATTATSDDQDAVTDRIKVCAPASAVSELVDHMLDLTSETEQEILVSVDASSSSGERDQAMLASE